MKFVDRIAEALGLFYEEDDEVQEETSQPEAVKQEEPKAAAPAFFTKKAAPKKQEPARELPPVPAQAEKKTSLFGRKTATGGEGMGSRTIALPLADKQVKVVVLEPGSFDDSQKIADYLRNNQPVVVNFENTDNVVTKRMTDFISGTIYALGGSMKKIGRSILVCAPKNVDIDAGNNVYDESGAQPWNK